jgi:HSP20 family protein
MNSTDFPRNFLGFGGDILSQLGRLQQELQEEFGNRGAVANARSLARTRRGPAVNIWISKEAAVLTAEVPGLKADEIAIEVQGQIVTLRAEAKQSEELQGYTCIRAERANSAFERSFELPFEIESEKVSARYDRGVLTLQLPRTEETKPRRISVSVG